MTESGIYESIAKRTGGDIYLGVVGPVRSGKSTFIHKFLESVVIPNIENEYDRERTQDEMPQSGSGKTITTTEPKFIPSESVKIQLGETNLNVRLIDCVGYMVDGAIGAYENGEERTVMTPWSDEPIPFTEAAELGTEKVVKEHSTIAMLVTTDGTIGDIPRESYVIAEERVASELKAINKPFAIILNSAAPETEEAHSLAVSLEEKYGTPVALVNCTRLNADDVREILSLVVNEFPVKELKFHIPEWCELLPEGHSIRTEIMEKIKSFSSKTRKIGDIDRILCDSCGITKIATDAGCGTGEFEIPLSTEVYYRTMGEMSGLSISSDKELFSAVCTLAEAKRGYDKISAALSEVNEHGYGIVMPSRDDLTITKPTLVKQGSGYGIKLTASAKSIHMIKTDIKADVCPVVGTEEQSEEVIKTMSAEFDEDPKKLLESKMFGRSVYDLVNDGMSAKLAHLPYDARQKLGETLEKIMNEGADGLICILL